MQIALPGSTVAPGGLILAQPARQAAAFEAVLWMGGLILGLLLLLVLLAYLRKRILASAPATGSGYSLDELRQMRDRGGLTIAEYEALRRKVLKER